MALKSSGKGRSGQYVLGVVANERGEIFELEGYAAVGMSGNMLEPLTEDTTVAIPHGGELMLLPDRMPVLFNMETGTCETLGVNPLNPHEDIFPVAAFNSPGYVITHNTAYEEEDDSSNLPLFSYGAVGWNEKGFRTAVILVDSERRQDLRLMPLAEIKAGVAKMREKYPENRLMRHLENCALVYGCPAAKNFFIGRCEAPLPTSRKCNARCLGCISFQPGGKMSSCQERISFTPAPDEIAQVAIEHIGKVEGSVVSFGQGCEGDPLLAFDVIEPGIRKIRAKTHGGTINMNTNASLPRKLAHLFDAGLDSIRVSMNSARPECYSAYFRPKGYSFSDVEESIRTANRKNKMVALNYLNCPGVTDTPEEFEALTGFLRRHRVNLIQWRNLNIDPAWYYSIMGRVSEQGEPMGMANLIKRLREMFPELRHGYFNPSKESMGWKDPA